MGIHKFTNEINVDTDLCDVCGKYAFVMIHIGARKDLITKRVKLTLSAPIVKDAIEMLSAAQQKKVKENISAMIDLYAADNTYALYEGSGY